MWTYEYESAHANLISYYGFNVTHSEIIIDNFRYLGNPSV